MSTSQPCQNAPVPEGYKPWLGTITPAMQQWAARVEVAARDMPNGGYGNSYLKDFDGVIVAAIVQRHDQTGTPGAWRDCNPCCHGVTLYRPPSGAAIPAPEPEGAGASASSRWRPLELVFLGTAIFGTMFTVGQAIFRARSERVRAAHRNPLPRGVHLYRVYNVETGTDLGEVEARSKREAVAIYVTDLNDPIDQWDLDRLRADLSPACCTECAG